jgi:hypothetical protein
VIDIFNNSYRRAAIDGVPSGRLNGAAKRNSRSLPVRLHRARVHSGRQCRELTARYRDGDRCRAARFQKGAGQKLDQLERRLQTQDQAIVGIVNAIRAPMSPPKQRPIGFTASPKENWWQPT